MPVIDSGSGDSGILLDDGRADPVLGEPKEIPGRQSGARNHNARHG